MDEPGGGADGHHDAQLHRLGLAAEALQLEQHVPRAIDPAVVHLEVENADKSQESCVKSQEKHLDLEPARIVDID